MEHATVQHLECYEVLFLQTLVLTPTYIDFAIHRSCCTDLSINIYSWLTKI